MKWCDAYTQMKEKKAFVRRNVWDTKYFIWLKPAVLIKLSWCKDENLKKVIKHFGKKVDGEDVLRAEDTLSLFNGFSVETGFQLRPEDKVADDWSVVDLN